MRNLTRALRELQDHGPRVLFYRLFGRLIYKRWRVRLFQDPPALHRQASVWPPGYQFQLCLRSASPSEGGHLVGDSAGATSLIAELDPGDSYYLVACGEEIAACGAVFASSPQRDVLGLSREAVLVGGCQTAERHRNRGLYRLALNDTARALRAAGRAEIFIEVRTDNEASIRGILAADFSEVGLVDARIWFGAWSWRNGSVHRIRRGVKP